MKKSLIFLLLILFGCESTTTFENKDKQEGLSWNEQWKMLRFEKDQNFTYEDFLQYWKNSKKHSLTQRTNNLSNLEIIGPSNQGGRARAFLIDSDDQSRYLAAGVTGGLFESTNSGGQWNPISKIDDNLGISWIDQSPFDADVLYYSTGEVKGSSPLYGGVGIFKSTDGGNSFNVLSATQNEDYAKTWRVVCSKIDPNTLYVATTKGLYVSIDSGDNFSQIFDKAVSDIELWEDGSIMIGAATEGVLLSSGAESNYDWQNITPSNTGLQYFPRTEIAYGASNPDKLYLAFSADDGNLLFKTYSSDDRGTTWNEISNPSGGFFMNQMSYCFAMTVHPANSDIVLMGAVHAVYSMNGGSNWDRISGVHDDHHLFYFKPNDTDEIISLSDGGISEFTINDEDEIKLSGNLNTGFITTQFYRGMHFPVKDVAIGGTQDNGTIVKEADSDRFGYCVGGDGGYVYVNQSNPKTIIASVQYGVIKRTTDFNSDNPILSGWSTIANNLDMDNNGTIDEGSWFVTPMEMNPYDSEDVIFFTRERPWLSRNKGDNFQPLLNPLDPFQGSLWTSAITRVDGTQKAIFGGLGGLIYRMNDFRNDAPGDEVNLNFSKPSELIYSNFTSLKFNPQDSDELFVGISSYADYPKLWKIKNVLGTNPQWESFEVEPPFPINDFEIHQDDENSIIIATDFGAFSYTQQNPVWERVSGFPIVPILDLSYRKADDQLFFYTHGRGIWQASFSEGTVTSTSLPSWDTSVFPNPANDKLHIDLADHENADFDIINIHGQNIFKGSLQNQSYINISHLAAGSYYIRLKHSDSKISVNKFQIIR